MKVRVYEIERRRDRGIFRSVSYVRYVLFRCLFSTGIGSQVVSSIGSGASKKGLERKG